MQFSSKSSLTNRFRRTALSLAFLLFSLPANAQKAPVYCLAQKVLQDGSILFFDSSHEDATFWNVDADRPYQDDPMLTESAGLNGYVLLTNAAVIVSYRGLSKSRIDSWLDRRGFVHSIAVLNRQLAFNQWLHRRRLSSSMIIHIPPSDDPAATSTLLLAEIPVTGIRYDPKTAWRSYRSTADNFYRNHLERIPKDYGISFSRASRGEPEDHVVQAADLNVLDSDKALRMHQLELEAKRRVDEAVSFLGDLD